MLLRYGTEGKYTLELFELKHVEATAQMILKSFATQNPLWRSFDPDLNKAFAYIRLQILPCVKDVLSYVLVDKSGRIVGAAITQDLFEFQQFLSIRQTNPLVIDEPLFEYLNIVGAELEQSVRTKKCVRGEECYGFYGVIDPDFREGGVSTWFWHACFLIAKMCGRKVYYCRVTNPVSLMMLQRLGATVIKQMKLSREDKGLVEYEVSLIELDLEKTFKIYTALL